MKGKKGKEGKRRRGMINGECVMRTESNIKKALSPMVFI